MPNTIVHSVVKELFKEVLLVSGTVNLVKKTVAGGAYTVSTAAAATVRSTIRRLRELAEA